MTKICQWIGLGNNLQQTWAYTPKFTGDTFNSHPVLGLYSWFAHELYDSDKYHVLNNKWGLKCFTQQNIFDTSKTWPGRPSKIWDLSYHPSRQISQEINPWDTAIEAIVMIWTCIINHSILAIHFWPTQLPGTPSMVWKMMKQTTNR